MSIADDPGQWTSKPAGNGWDHVDTSVVQEDKHSLHDYWMLRDVLYNLLMDGQMSTTSLARSVVRRCREALEVTPKDGSNV